MTVSVERILHGKAGSERRELAALTTMEGGGGVVKEKVSGLPGKSCNRSTCGRFTLVAGYSNRYPQELEVERKMPCHRNPFWGEENARIGDQRHQLVRHLILVRA